MVKRNIASDSKLSKGIKICPRCEGKGLRPETDVVDLENGLSSQDKSCRQCGHFWTETYRKGVCIQIEFDD